MRSWKDTKIWKKLSEIQEEAADDVRSTLNNKLCMPTIETLLSKGGTSPKDFTLHDSDHSFRVAERMWLIIPKETQVILSEYELALLLLSAYLHDIGMTPEYKKVENHHNILLKENHDLSLSEIGEFQKWLDEEGISVDLDRNKLEDESKIEEWVTLYCRHKHNDWSKEWINNNLSDKQLSGFYANWINDLIIICQSHHWGLEELKDSQFDPIRINGKVIHKRYIAMCLRLSDVIEIDPERAPDVLMKHRSVIEGSISHWLKEQFTSVDIINGNITVTARPTQAFIHKAILDVADQIERETFLCNSLIQEKPLSHISPTHNLKHTWNILPIVYRDIKETGNYEFIDGTFKPNTEKLLELFAGTELYGNPLLAIRELIQNAFDANKVQIAYRIFKDNLNNEQQFNSLKQLFNVDLNVTKEGEDIWLICSDNGVGMDKDIIKKCFLVSGSQRRRELLELERKCKSIGYDLELTGRFGIGVMSYFMLADKMIITTKKSFESGNLEQNGWEFEINGLADFGELRKVDTVTNGTNIKLRIKKELVAQFENENILCEFLKQALARIPCNFKYNYFNSNKIEYLPGWCKDKTHFENYVLDSFNRACRQTITNKEYISHEEIERMEKSNKRLLEMTNRFTQSLNFLECEGKLSENNGYFRLHIPYFKNFRGDSFSFFFEENNVSTYLLKINDGFLYKPVGNIKYTSWKGMSVTIAYSNKIPTDIGFIELDLINNSSSQISVSRLDLTSINYPNILREIEAKIRELISINKNGFTDSCYSFYNYLQAPFIGLSNNVNWSLNYLPKENTLDKIEVNEVHFPILFDITHYWDSSDKYTTYNSNEIFRFHDLKECGYGGKSIEKNMFKYDIAVLEEYWQYKISFLILGSLKENSYSYIGNSAQFPKEWEVVFCYRGSSNDIVLNENNPYFRYVSEECYNSVRKVFQDNSISKETKELFYLTNKENSICFLLYLIKTNNMDYWIGMTQQNESFVKSIWRKIFNDEDFVFYFMSIDTNDSNKYKGLVALSTKGLTSTTERRADIEKSLPIPSEEWIIKQAK